MTPTGDVSDDELAKAYNEALRYAAKKAAGRGDELEQALIDAATDGVMKAREKFDPAKSKDGFGAFCGAVVRSRVARAVGRWAEQLRTRPGMARLGDLDQEEGEAYSPPAPDKPIAGSIPLGADLRDLPEHLRTAVRFVYADGYSLADAGLLLGVAAPTVGDWLRKAAAMLAEDGAVAPARRKGEKRVRGGIGH